MLLLALAARKRRGKGAMPLALLLFCAGCVLITLRNGLRFGLQSVQGILTAVGAATSLSVFGLLLRKLTKRYSAWTALFYAAGFGAVLLVALSAIEGQAGLLAVHNPMSVGGLSILLLAWLGSLLAAVCYTASADSTAVDRVGKMSLLEPVVAAVLAYSVLGERMTSIEILGLLLTVAAVVVLSRRGPSTVRP
jgi:DME family drug/metabolite transporter